MSRWPGGVFVPSWPLRANWQCTRSSRQLHGHNSKFCSSLAPMTFGNFMAKRFEKSNSRYSLDSLEKKRIPQSAGLWFGETVQSYSVHDASVLGIQGNQAGPGRGGQAGHGLFFVLPALNKHVSLNYPRVRSEHCRLNWQLEPTQGPLPILDGEGAELQSPISVAQFKQK